MIMRKYIAASLVGRAVYGITILLLGTLASVAPSRAENGRWTPLGPEGGKVSALLASPTNPAVVYAGMDQGGVFRSVDGGNRWQLMSQGLNSSRVNHFAITPTGEATLYAATDRGVFRLPAGTNIWEEASDGLLPSFPYVHEIVIDPFQPERIYATVSLALFSGSWALYRSDDGGDTWAESRASQIYDPPVAVLKTTPATVIASSFQGVFRSQDQGTTWQLHTEGLPDHPIFRDFVTHPSNPMIVYASVRDLLGHGRIPYKSLDGGQTWSQAANGLPESVVRQRDAGMFATDPGQPDTLFFGTIDGVYRSNDGALSWFPVHGEPADGTIRSLAVGASGGTVFAGSASEAGVLRSEDGGANWEARSEGFLGTSVFAISPDPAIPGRVLANSEMGILVSDDLGTHWRAAINGRLGGAGQFVRDVDDPAMVYFPGGNSMYRTTDSGATWLPFGPFFEGTIQSFRQDSASDFYLTAGGRVWQSSDGGSAWSPISEILCGRKLFLSPALADGSLVAACVESSDLPVSPPAFEGSIFRSRNGGESWTLMLGPLYGTIDGDWFLAGSADGAGTLYAALAGLGSGTVLRSEDFGETWEPVTALADVIVQSILVDADNPEEVAVGTTDRGVLRSFDGGETWQSLSDGLISNQVNGLAQGLNMSEKLWAGTGAGVHVLRSFPLCVPTPRSICLGDRFLAEVTWEDFRGRTGEGVGESLSSTTGTFWFFNQENIELVVKVLDGRTVNGHHWLYWGGMSNVKYTLTVTDLQTGRQEVVENPLGTLGSGGKITAFPEAQGSAMTPMAAEASHVEEDLSSGSHAVRPRESGLLLQDERFRIDVVWRTPDGRSGTAVGSSLTSESGTLWFFNPENLELFVKVLDGRAVNGHFWLFFAGLSNLEFDLTVTDTETGASRSYQSPQGAFASQVDIELF